MKRVLTLLILLVTAFSGISARKAEPYGSYRPYTRWWWFADNIRKTDVRDQLIWAKEAGLGGVEIAWINARQKLPDLGTPQPWLSEEWGRNRSICKNMCGLAWSRMRLHIRHAMAFHGS